MWFLALAIESGFLIKSPWIFTSSTWDYSRDKLKRFTWIRKWHFIHMQYILVKQRFLSQHVDYDNRNNASDPVFGGILSRHSVQILQLFGGNLACESCWIFLENPGAKGLTFVWGIVARFSNGLIQIKSAPKIWPLFIKNKMNARLLVLAKFSPLRVCSDSR